MLGSDVKKNPRVCSISPSDGAEKSVTGMQVEKEKVRKRRRRDGDVERGEMSSAVQYSTEGRGEERSVAHNQSSALNWRLHAHSFLQDEKRERDTDRRGRKDKMMSSNTTDEPAEIDTMEMQGGKEKKKDCLCTCGKKRSDGGRGKMERMRKEGRGVTRHYVVTVWEMGETESKLCL